tara:strand:- start:962 stop:1816 length:855 start_codon:yes stop_codon:yes gene_type:complete
VDLNRDGHRDVISGSWPGQLYIFHGQKDKTFKKPVILKDRNGKPIKVGSASVVFAADWDNDGDRDLLVGNIKGEIYVIANESKSGDPVYSDPVKLQAGGTDIRTKQGDSAPLVVDWDGDGKLDLLSGAGDGSVVFYRNSGSREKPVFDAAQILVKASPNRNKKEKVEGPNGSRAKIAVVDWNNDGQLDLLVGDYNSQYTKVELTREQLDQRKVAQAAYDKVMVKYRAHSARRPKRADKEATAKWSAEFQELSKEMRGHRSIMNRFNPVKRSSHGNVWLYLRSGG